MLEVLRRHDVTEASLGELAFQKILVIWLHVVCVVEGGIAIPTAASSLAVIIWGLDIITPAALHYWLLNLLLIHLLKISHIRFFNDSSSHLQMRHFELIFALISSNRLFDLKRDSHVLIHVILTSLILNLCHF